MTTLEGIRDISGEGKKREARVSTGHSKLQGRLGLKVKAERDPAACKAVAKDREQRLTGPFTAPQAVKVGI